MRIKSLYFVLIVLLIFVFLILNVLSCSTSQKKSVGVISLLDSLGVGDVPSYSGAHYDKELNEQLGEFRNQLEIPSEYMNVLYTVFTADGKHEDAAEHYNKTLESLNWEKNTDISSEKSNFTLWLKESNYGKDISYIVITGEISYANKNQTVILTGMIIPERDDIQDNITQDTREGSEIGPGEIFFKNPLPPEGQGLIDSKPFSFGIEKWQMWLQGGSKVKGTNEVKLLDDKDFDKVVQFYRISEPFDGGAAGIYQGLDLDLDKYSKVNIWLVGKVIKEKGGNIANVNHPDFPEGAVQVRVKYITQDNEEKEWLNRHEIGSPRNGFP